MSEILWTWIAHVCPRFFDFGWVMFEVEAYRIWDVCKWYRKIYEAQSIPNLSNAGYRESPAILANFSVCNILSFLC